MGLAEKNDSSYWQKYSRFIKYLTLDLDDGSGGDRFVFICPDSTSAPLASVVVAMAITNKRVHDIGDGLLDAKNLVYDGAGSFSYFTLVEDYMNAVLVKGDTSQGSQDALDTAKKAWTTALSAFSQAKTDAHNLYDAVTDSDKPEFTEWAVQNVATYTTTKDDENTAFDTYRQAQITVAGPRGEQYARAVRNISRVTDALDDKAVSPGFTMATMSSDSVTFTTLKSAEAKHFDGVNAATEPAASKCAIVPEYSIDDYRTAMDEWVNEFDSAGTDSIGFTDSQLNSDDTKDTTHTSEHFDGAASWGLFRFGGVSHDQVNDSNTVTSSSDSNDINFTFTWKHKKLFTLGPGVWDIPGMYEEFPDLRPDAPKEPTTVYYRPVEILCVDGLGMTAQLKGSVKTQFEQQLKSHQSTSGDAGFGISCFGISGKYGNDQDDDHTSHTVHYTESDSTVTFAPKKQLGTCTMLAIIANKVKPSN